MGELELGWGHGRNDVLAMDEAISALAQNLVEFGGKCCVANARHAEGVDSLRGDTKFGLCTLSAQDRQRPTETVPDHKQRT